MNFYIFNSDIKSTRRFLMIAGFSFLLFNIAMDAALRLFVDIKTTPRSYVEEKRSKGRHMQLQAGNNGFDIIFVGSSRTSYHISRNTFLDKGLSIYNYGVAGADLIDFPSMVHKAMALKPRAIAISINVGDFYADKGLGSYKKVNWDDLPFVFKTQPLNISLAAATEWLKNQHSLAIYAEPIYIKLQQYYRKFIITFARDKAAKLPEIRKSKIIPQADCDIFDLSYPSEFRTVAKCTNGDGILFGHRPAESAKEQAPKPLNRHNVDFFNALLDDINRHGATAIVILEPMLHPHSDASSVFLKQAVRSNRIIDLSSLALDENLWIDSAHLNNAGRLVYSGILADRISPLFDQLNRAETR